MKLRLQVRTGSAQRGEPRLKYCHRDNVQQAPEQSTLFVIKVTKRDNRAELSQCAVKYRWRNSFSPMNFVQQIKQRRKSSTTPNLSRIFKPMKQLMTDFPKSSTDQDNIVFHCIIYSCLSLPSSSTHPLRHPQPLSSLTGYVPDPDRLIEGGRDHQVLGGMEAGAHDVVVVPRQDTDTAAALPVPHTDRLKVKAGGRQMVVMMMMAKNNS